MPKSELGDHQGDTGREGVERAGGFTFPPVPSTPIGEGYVARRLQTPTKASPSSAFLQVRRDSGLTSYSPPAAPCKGGAHEQEAERRRARESRTAVALREEVSKHTSMIHRARERRGELAWRAAAGLFLAICGAAGLLLAHSAALGFGALAAALSLGLPLGWTREHFGLLLRVLWPVAFITFSAWFAWWCSRGSLGVLISIGPGAMLALLAWSPRRWWWR